MRPKGVNGKKKGEGEKLGETEMEKRQKSFNVGDKKRIKN